MCRTDPADPTDILSSYLKIFCTKMGYIKIILYLCSQLSVLVDARVSSLRKLWLITLRNSSTRAVLAFGP